MKNLKTVGGNYSQIEMREMDSSVKVLVNVHVHMCVLSLLVSFDTGFDIDELDCKTILAFHL